MIYLYFINLISEPTFQTPMISKGKILIVLFVIGICFIGCKKDRRHYYISPIVKELGFYQKQSYWVFKNESTQKIDCTYINKDPDVYTWNIDDYSDEPLIDEILVEFNSNILDAYKLTGEFILGYMANDLFCVPFNGNIGIGQTVGTTSKYSFIGLYDKLTINDNTFYSVYHTRYSILMKEQPPDTLTCDMFLVPHVGLVKINIRRDMVDTTWTLLRYDVKQ